MDSYDPAMVFSSIDHQGRYAYGNQPGIAHWNLARLAQALLPVIHENEERALAVAQEGIEAFPGLFQEAWRDGMAGKLGLPGLEEDDEILATDLLELMAQERADFTLSFRRLADLAAPESIQGIGELFEFPGSFEPWLERWRQRIKSDGRDPGQRQVTMYRANPVFIPRNHLVAAAIDAAVSASDYAPFNQLVDLLERPRDYEPSLAGYARPPGRRKWSVKLFAEPEAGEEKWRGKAPAD